MKIRTLIILGTAVLSATGCNEHRLPAKSESAPDTSVSSETEITGKTEPEFQQNTESLKKDIMPVTSLDLAEADEWDTNSKRKIYFTADNGSYYYIEAGGRDSANYVLSFDSGDGNPVQLNNAEDCTWHYFNGKVLYGWKYETGLCRYENGLLTALNERSNTVDSAEAYYTKDYIWFYCSDNKSTIFYRMDYNGENTEEAAIIDNNYRIRDFAIYEDKIWFGYIDRKSGDYSHKFASYDLNTNDIVTYDNGGIGLINNGYMYYTDDENRLLRFSLTDYNCELVIDSPVFSFDFCDEYIIYSWEDSLCRFNGNENTVIFSADEYFENEYTYEIGSVQCENERIYIDIMSGAFYSYIAELDIYGNNVIKIHEDK